MDNLACATVDLLAVWKETTVAGCLAALPDDRPGHETVAQHAENAGPTCRETLARHAMKGWPGIT